MCKGIILSIIDFKSQLKYFKVKNHEHFNDYFSCCFFLSDIDLLRNILKCNSSPYPILMTMYLPGAILCSNVLHV